jgi:hypothetical protein
MPKANNPSDALAIARELALDFARTYPLRDQRREFPYEEMKKLKESGLLAFTIPAKYGGAGLPFASGVECLMVLAAANPSVAQMYFVHCIIVLSLMELASADQQRWLFRQVVENQVFIGNAASEKQSKHVMVFETTFTPARSNDGVHIRGKKFFTTGSLAADYFLVFGRMGDRFAAAVVAKDAPGMTIQDDWKAMGQRGTASGTIDFHDVFVPRDMVLPPGEDAGNPASLLGPIYQIGFSAIHTGIARGALACASEYVRTKSRPWPDSGADTAAEDPYHSAGTRQHVGVSIGSRGARATRGGNGRSGAGGRLRKLSRRGGSAARADLGGSRGSQAGIDRSSTPHRPEYFSNLRGALGPYGRRSRPLLARCAHPLASRPQGLQGQTYWRIRAAGKTPKSGAL